MPKRKIDPTTVEPQLTYREQMLVDEFIRNMGNAPAPLHPLAIRVLACRIPVGRSLKAERQTNPFRDAAF